jgi:siroheme synthase-like protein
LSADGTIAAIEDTPLDVQLRAYSPGEAAGYRLVVTATGVPEVDRMVASDADRAGVWVNSADDPANCTFLLPAVERRGPVVVSVSTSGTSPALATWLRKRIGASLGPGLEELAALLEEGRHLVKDRGDSTESIDWASILDGPIVELVAAGRIDEARALLLSALIPGASGAGPEPPAD